MDIAYCIAQKPDDWPVNMAEQSLDIVLKALNDFIEKPGYVTKENLISLVSDFDLNERDFIGQYRICEYEVSQINEIYYRSLMICLPSSRCYLYRFIGERARLQKMIAYAGPIIDNNELPYIGIKPYENGLCLPLRLYYFAYLAYIVDKDKPFAKKLVDVVNEMRKTISLMDELSDDEKSAQLFELSRNYTLMLNDMSYFHGNKKEEIWKFDRNELAELFSLEAELIRLTSQTATPRPLRGVLMTQISNFILKSRHDYNEDYICKYVSENVAITSYMNHEIWMNKIENLNDDREGNVLKELFENSQWIKHNWVRKPDLTPVRTYFVSSFAKSVNSDHMKDHYGKIVFGYKNDRIADLISPLYQYKQNSTRKPLVFFSQVMAYDVIYDKAEAQEELNYLFDIIALFNLTDEEKNTFLQEILQYWLLSIKDSKWSPERERRYVLFLYESYEYKEMKIKNDFLKLKTSLFITPDFLIGNYQKKEKVKIQIDVKRKCLSYKVYLYCHNCLNRDYDVVVGRSMNKQCPICASDDIEIVYP